MVPETVPHGSTAQSGGIAKSATGLRRCRPAAASSHVPLSVNVRRVLVRPSEDDLVGLQDRIAHVRERQLRR
jgi:hypothetical protein